MRNHSRTSSRVRAWWLALFFGVALASSEHRLHAAPDEPAPAGFTWEDLKEIHSRALRPEKWFFRRDGRPLGPVYHFAPQAFEGEGELKKGLTLAVLTKVRDRMQKPADEYAISELAELAAKEKVLKGWTRKGEPAGPYTTYALVFLSTEEGDSTTSMVKIVFVVNHETDTLYSYVLASPRAEWKEVEAWGDTMLANLHLDPKF